ncbi:MAG TPA: hypothetical protein VLL52_25990 [Anaerolineae bacterium]|nr:hypothetical protein [Anaerolineae bacterium]
MNSGKRDGGDSGKSDAKVPAEVQAFADWLRRNPHVIEVWSIYSDWPQLQTGRAMQTLDSGLWFFCRLNLDEGRLPEGVVPIREEEVAALAEFIVSYVGPPLVE